MALVTAAAFPADYLRYNGRMKRHTRGDRGFTLIELLVVLVIIGIFALIAFASFEEARKKSRDTARSADMEQLSAALRVYAATYGRYPSSSDGSCTGTASFGGAGCLQVLVTAGLYSALPQDPKNTATQVYQYDNTCNSPSGSSDQRYRAWTIGERDQGATTLGWTDSKTIGATSCTDPQ